MNDETRYGKLREELTYEAQLIVQRTGWFVASQAFLFAPLVIGLPSNGKVLGDSLLFPLIPLVAIVVCLIVLISVLAGIAAASQIRAAIIELTNDHPELKEIFPVRKSWVIWAGLGPTVILPVVFTIAWFLVLLPVSV